MFGVETRYAGKKAFIIVTCVDGSYKIYVYIRRCLAQKVFILTMTQRAACIALASIVVQYSIVLTCARVSN